MRGGGAERVALNLAKGFIQKGHEVHLILVKAEGPLMNDVPEGAVVIDLNKSRTTLSIFSLASCLRRHKYDALITFMNHASVVAFYASKLAAFKGKIISTIHSSIIHSLINQPDLRNRVLCFFMKRVYGQVDKVVVVSQGLKHEYLQLIKTSNVKHIYNPLETVNKDDLSVKNEISQLTKNKQYPLIIAAGRLTLAKNYELLINSFYNIHQYLNAKLIVLGEGEDRHRLESQIKKLGLCSEVILKGFVPNPQAYIKEANLFVLSSAWEGFGLVIAEALAHGVTVVSTDCQVGPSEILENGRYGYLVPVNDEEKMSKAIIHALNNPMDPALLRKRAADFSIEKVSQNYLDLIFESD